MISDLLVFPIVIINAIIIKASLTGIGKNNGVIFLTSFFLLTHFGLTLLTYLQRKHLEDSYVTVMEGATFNAVLSSLSASVAYLMISGAPFLTYPFFFLRWLPHSQMWADLFIVAIPAYITHYAGGYVISDILTNSD